MFRIVYSPCTAIICLQLRSTTLPDNTMAFASDFGNSFCGSAYFVIAAVQHLSSLSFIFPRQVATSYCKGHLENSFCNIVSQRRFATTFGRDSLQRHFTKSSQRHFSTNILQHTFCNILFATLVRSQHHFATWFYSDLIHFATSCWLVIVFLFFAKQTNKIINTEQTQASGQRYVQLHAKGRARAVRRE